MAQYDMIVTSLLDTDLYKFTMQQVVFHHFPDAQAEYTFICRTPGVDLSNLRDDILHEIRAFCQLRFLPEELAYLEQFSYFKTDYLQFLQNFEPNFKYLHLGDQEFNLRIQGPWVATILFEVPLLAIISEIYNRQHSNNLTIGRKKLQEKIQLIQQSACVDKFRLVDFGTRRRYSFAWQKELTQALKKDLPATFMGTSNVLLAKEFALTPMGTMAHEYLEACQVFAPSLEDSQRFALQTWLNEYQRQLSIALTDVYNLKSFLRDFDQHFAKSYQGVRHDSGDPTHWAKTIIDHYEKLGIHPQTKTLVFSDGLSIPKALELCSEFNRYAHLIFGIGTHLTNDVDVKPIEIIIKMTGCNGKPVGKLTDDPTKTVCLDAEYLAKLQKTFPGM